MLNNASLFCAVRGPLMLIILGTLMAIDHAGGMRFSRTWPVLIIVFGVLKLAEYMNPSQQTGQPR